MPATWKRQNVSVSGYKFDYIDVNEFTSKSWVARLRYIGPFIMSLKSIFIYMADISILALFFIWMAEGDHACDASATIQVGSFCASQQARSVNFIRVEVRPYIILASVIFSFVLLFLDWRKALTIIQSGDIAYAFTSNIASRYYTLKSFPHFCFFLRIKDSRKIVDRLAFFVFFVFKGWKRLLLAELPRQVLNGLMIFDVVDPFFRNSSLIGNNKTFFNDSLGVHKIFIAYQTVFSNGANVTRISLALQTFTVLMWLFSLTGLIIAFLIYLPLLANIKGNLKEYCCHKIDLRLEELLQKKIRKRLKTGGSEFGDTGSRYSGSSYGPGSKFGKDPGYNNYPPSAFGGPKQYLPDDQQTAYSDPYYQQSQVRYVQYPNYVNQPPQFLDDASYQTPGQPYQPYGENQSQKYHQGYGYQQQQFDQGYNRSYEYGSGGELHSSNYDPGLADHTPSQRQPYSYDSNNRYYERSGSKSSELPTPSDTTYVEDYANPRQRQYMNEDYEVRTPQQQYRNY